MSIRRRLLLSAASSKWTQLKLKGNLSDSPPILTVGRLTHEHKQQKRVCELFISKYFFNENDFSYYFENVPLNSSVTDPMSMAKRRRRFLALWVRKLRNKFNLIVFDL